MNEAWLTCSDCGVKRTTLSNEGWFLDPDPEHWEFHCGCVPITEVE